MYYVTKRGAVLSNGEVLYPGDIVNNTGQDLQAGEAHYLIAKSLEELKAGKYRKCVSTIKEFDSLYNTVLRNVTGLKPLKEAMFTEGQLVKLKGTVDMGIVGNKDYDYETLQWKYKLYAVDSIRNIHSHNLTIGLYNTISVYEDEVVATNKGTTKLEIGKETYNVYYTLIQGGKK